MTLTKELLIEAGVALYPSDWTMWLSHELGIGIRPLRRMAQGSVPIPPNLGTELLALMQKRRSEIAAIENKVLAAMREKR